MPGYRLEYASSNRAKCKGPKPCAGRQQLTFLGLYLLTGCSGSVLTKGCLRFGTTVEFQGKQSFAWRHWGCVTSKVLSNVKNEHPDASDVDGFEELRPEDQQKVIKAWEEGKVAEEDIPETAKKADGDEDGEEDDEKPKKKARTTKKKADEDGEEKPKKARATKAKAKVGVFCVCIRVIDSNLCF
ncbi:zf-PARP-domain-containing protein [Lentinula raphanica]|nr:zf-PARP-domain-containing protein [Lentinula raphanica]